MDDGSTCGRTSDAVFLHRLAEFFVVHIAPCRLHGAEQRGFGEGFGRSRLLLRERGRVRACFPLLKGWQGALIVRALHPSIARLRCCPTLACCGGGGRSGIRSTLSGSIGLGEEHAPTFFDNHLTTGAEGDASRFTIDGGGGKSAVGIEHGDEALHDEVVDIALHIGEPLWQHTCGDDGVVVGDFGVVKHLFRLAQGSMAQGFEPLRERHCAPHVIIADALEDGRAAVVHVVGQIGGVYTRIGGKFVFVELLDELQGEVGTIAILLVALHLQAR